MMEYVNMSKGKVSSQKRKSRGTGGAPRELAPPVGENLLPDIPGDDQHDVLPREGQVNGLRLRIPEWPQQAGPGDDYNLLQLYLQGRQEPISSFQYGIGAVPNPLMVTVSSQYLRTHGAKEIYYNATFAPDLNPDYSRTLEIFVDALDPNLNDLPAAIELPPELQASKVLTPELLSSLGGKVTLTIPDPEDRRAGDTYAFYWGNGLSTPTVSGPAPDTGPIVFDVPGDVIAGLGQGFKVLRYTVTDRAGNRSQFSIPDTVEVLLSDPPQNLWQPDVPAAEQLPGDYIDREEARSGVLVEIPRYDNAQGGDKIILEWQGIHVVPDPQVGPLPIFPVECTVPYTLVAFPGTTAPYRAEVKYWVERGGVLYPAPSKFVDVDLVVPGDPIVGPGPVDPNLTLPVVRGNSGQDNELTPADSGFPATMRFPLPGNLSMDDEIEGFYGPGDGHSVGTYVVTGNEGPGFEVVFQIDWETVISVVGNGLIPCWYKVSNDRNFKVSQKQDVTVDVNNFDITELVEFLNKDIDVPGGPTIRCAHSPWLGIPIRILAPNSLAVRDEVELLVKGMNWDFSQDISGPAQVIPHTVVANDISQGIRLTIDYAYFAQVDNRFGIEVLWTIKKAVGGGGGTSPVSRARVTLRMAGGTCAP